MKHFPADDSWAGSNVECMGVKEKYPTEVQGASYPAEVAGHRVGLPMSPANQWG